MVSSPTKCMFKKFMSQIIYHRDSEFNEVIIATRDTWSKMDVSRSSRLEISKRINKMKPRWNVEQMKKSQAISYSKYKSICEHITLSRVILRNSKEKKYIYFRMSSFSWITYSGKQDWHCDLCLVVGAFMEVA